MFRYANYQICIFMNINENIKNKRKIVKIKGEYMQIYPHLSCLLSYSTCLGTNLMLIHIMFYIMDQYANYLKIVFMNIN